MIKIFSKEQINEWHKDVLTEVKARLENEWSIPTTFFALLWENNKLKVSVITPPNEYTYNQAADAMHHYLDNNPCIAILWVSQTSLPVKNKNLDFFYCLRTAYDHEEYLQKYQLYPEFKFSPVRIYKKINFLDPSL